MNQLQNEMDAMFGRASSGGNSAGRGVYPPVNLYETNDAYVLTAELPGVDPGDIHVSLENTTVTLQGERKLQEATTEDASFHRRERSTGTFRRAFELPVAIDGDNVEATHKNGVLVLTLPKSPEAQPRQISVQASR